MKYGWKTRPDIKETLCYSCVFNQASGDRDSIIQGSGTYYFHKQYIRVPCELNSNLPILARKNKCKNFIDLKEWYKNYKKGGHHANCTMTAG